jgi:hypothetical protein
VTYAYQETDWEIADYQIYCLDKEIIDRSTNAELLLRGPKPKSLNKGEYFACIGAAQTFGRFCEKPYPIIMQEKLGISALNLGRGGAGPSFFFKDNKKLFEYVNNAKFVIIQVMSGRSASNSLFESQGLGCYVRRLNGAHIGCDEAFKELLATSDKDYVKKIVAETRDDWIQSFQEILESITVPKILFWFSTRRPNYQEKYTNVSLLFGEFPQLVNLDMIRQLRNYCDYYVECVSRRGMPQPLINRFTGESTKIKDSWGGGEWLNNWYYPSPKMHIDAAKALDKVCKRLVLPKNNSVVPKNPWLFFFK